MTRFLRKIWIGLIILWIFWGSLLTGQEVIRLRIPKTLYLYEEEATAVLSGSQTKVDPQKLYLDFEGDVAISETADGDYEAVCKLFGVIPIKAMEVEVVSKQELIPGGIPVGIYVQTDGVFVIGTGNIEGKNGQMESPAKNILKTGDYITSIQGKTISKKQELIDALKEIDDEQVTLGVRRNQENIEVAIKTVTAENGAQLGVWVRDDTQGVGTLTFITEDGQFGALGHGISDADSELLMEVSKGKLYDCEIFEITKGEKGSPGKLSGRIIYNHQNLYGEVTGNLSGGIYGKANGHLLASVPNEPLPIALKQEVEEGEAVILSSVDGQLQEYAIEIKKVHRSESDVNKGMELLVTDERLLSLTGGIVQGMSGSPIIQDGRIVGAVTHVLVNDPTRGYGIFIENMLHTLQ